MPKQPSSTLTSNRALLGIPLVVVLVFSFSFVMMQHDTTLTQTIDSKAKAPTKKQLRKTSNLSAQTQTELPTLEVPTSKDVSAVSTPPTTTASPQNPSTAPTQSANQRSMPITQPSPSGNPQQPAVNTTPQTLQTTLIDTSKTLLQGLGGFFKK